MEKICKIHGLTKFASREGGKRWRCSKCQVEAVQKNREKIKEKAIEYKGGCCERCGYNKCNTALEFHHIDPLEKDFAIGDGGNTRGWERVRKEIDKCILVCANCHREIHMETKL